MRIHHTYIAAISLLAATGSLSAQQSRSRESPPDRDRDDRQPRRAFTITTLDADRPRLGITLAEPSRQDTLGVLVDDVTPDGPAARAGIRVGDRLTAINGVNLRVSPEEASAEDMEGIGARRLTRELGKLAAGDEVELKVWRDGSTRTIKAKTGTMRDLLPARATFTARRDELEGRATLGIGLGTSGSKRDTLGVLVSSLNDEGPAAKSGMVEGDRIAAINGVDLRVPSDDAGDWEASAARLRRLTREMEKVKAGDDVELRVYRGGQTRSVRVKTVARRDLPERRGRMMFFGDGDVGLLDGMRVPLPAIAPLPPTPPNAPDAPMPPSPPRAPRAPRLYFYGPDGGPNEIRMRISPEVRERVDEAMRRATELQEIRPRIRMQLRGGGGWHSGRRVTI